MRGKKKETRPQTCDLYNQMLGICNRCGIDLTFFATLLHQKFKKPKNLHELKLLKTAKIILFIEELDLQEVM